MEKLNLKTVLAALLFVATAFAGQVQAQFQSDFQIKQNFDRDHADVLDALKSVQTEDGAESLADQIDDMEERYADHTNLLNRVLYPETVEARITNLRELSVVIAARISRIGEKDDTIIVLEEQISELMTDADRYQELADSLNNELNAMRRSRDANAAQARRLRQELDQRDAFIIKMVDSTFVAYENVDLTSLSPGERRGIALEIDARNILGYIESVLDNNISFLDTHTELSTEDFLKLYSVQVEFNRMWDNMGRDIARIYVSETNREERLTDIDEKVDEWEMLIDDAAWSTLSDAFQQNDIQLSSFNNSLQFYTSLNTYLDEAIARSEENGSEEEVANYQQFADFWFNNVKPRWQEYLISANLLTYDNFNTIDAKLTDWKLHAQPTSYTTLIFLGLAIIVLLVVLGLWIRERGQKKSSKK